MRRSLQILSLSVLASGAAYAQGGGPVTMERLTITGAGSTGDVSGMSVTPPGASATSLSGLFSVTPRVGSDDTLSVFGRPVIGKFLPLIPKIPTVPAVPGEPATADKPAVAAKPEVPEVPEVPPRFDISTAWVAPTRAATILRSAATPLADLLSTVPVPFSKYGPGGQAGVDATETFRRIREDRTSPTVFLPAGQYDIAKCVSDHYFSSNTKLVGAGIGKTRIRFTGPSCDNTLFSWGGNLENFGAQDLTVDWGGARCSIPEGVCSAFNIANNKYAKLENIEIIRSTGDRWLPIHVAGSKYGTLRNIYIKPTDCIMDWTANTGVLLGASYSLASKRIGSISGNVLTISGRESGDDITLGQAVTGGPNVPRDLYITAFGTGTKDNGTYILNKAVPADVPEGTLYLNSTYGWLVENSRFINTNVSFDSPMNTSRNNEVGPYCAGPGMNASIQAAYHTSIGDIIHDGPSIAGEDDLFDTGLEFHGPGTQVINSRVYNVSSACLAYTGGRTLVQGGTCERFNTGAIQDATFTGSISGNVLTVTSVASGVIQRGQVLTVPGSGLIVITKGGTGTGGTGTYLLQSAAAQPIASTTMTATLFASGAALYASNGLNNGVNSNVNGYTVRGSGTAGEKSCFADNSAATGITVQGVQCSGISGASPYRIQGGTTVAGIGAVQARGLTVYDGNPFGSAPKYAAGLATENGGDRINLGINDSRFGAQVTADPGFFLRMQPGAYPLELFTRPAGSGAALPVLSFTTMGGISASGNITASHFTVGASPGVSCSGPPTANFRVTNGIVTRC